jgi:hypothetical protein
MDSAELDVAAIAPRYLAGDLSEADAATFEARIASEPRLYRDIDLSLRLKEGLARLQARGELEPIVRQGRRRFLIAAAIAAALLVVVGLVWVSRTGLRGESVTLARSAAELVDAQGRPLPVAARVLLARTRGGMGANEVRLPEARAAIELLLLPPRGEEQTRYRISIKRRDAAATTQVARMQGVAADASGYIDVFVDASTLRPGNYAMEVQREGDGDNFAAGEGEVAFDVTAK